MINWISSNQTLIEFLGVCVAIVTLVFPLILSKKTRELILKYCMAITSHINSHFIRPVVYSYKPNQTPKHIQAIDRIYDKMDMILKGGQFDYETYYVVKHGYDAEREPFYDRIVANDIKCLKTVVSGDGYSVSINKLNIFHRWCDYSPDIIFAIMRNFGKLFSQVCDIKGLSKYPIEYKKAIALRDMFDCEYKADWVCPPHEEWLIDAYEP